MIRAASFLILMAIGPMASAGAQGAACSAKAEAACMLEAAWTAAQALPQKKSERLKPLFAPLALQLTDPAARAVWDARLGETAIEIAGTDYVRRTAETAIGEHGWETFLRRARDGAAPLH
ncbi:MAG: hypothetical protein ACK4P2_09990, partial [Hyphomonas sp.]